MFQLYVFDLDGTLVDSRRDLADSINLLLEACGASPLPETMVGKMVGDGARTLVARAFAAANHAPPADALERFLEIYDARLLVHTRAYPEVERVLGELHERASLAVLTNKPLRATESVLAGLGLARYFADDAILGGDGPFPRKPDPAGLRHLADAAGVKKDATLLVGDSVVDWKTARNAETPICLARYGFGFETFPVEQLGADDVVIDTPGDILDL
jgi:phosphoglycolate phosphatase